MSYYPKLSIVSPSYNQVDFLEDTINSILEQNYPNLEYVIIDGGSKDGSVDIIKKYEHYLHYWCSEPDGGQYAAINKGFSHTTGEIMAWLNSDDKLCPWALRTVASIMTDIPQIKWLSTLYPLYWDYYGFCCSVAVSNGYCRDALLDGYYLPPLGGKSWIQQESTFWRRDLWEKVGAYINTDLKLASDFELWCRFSKEEELYGVNCPLGGFRNQPFQKSKSIGSYTQEAKSALEQLRDELDWKPKKIRNFMLDLRCDQVPLLRRYVLSTYGYVGRKIIRKNEDSPTAHWAVQGHHFL